GEDDDHFRRLIASCEDNGGKVDLVLLRCDPEELKSRIGNESRVKIGKLADPDAIDRSLARYDLRTPFPDRDSLVIDTTGLDPEAAATTMIEYFALAPTAEALPQQNM